MSRGISVTARIRGAGLFGKEGKAAHLVLTGGQPLLLDREPGNPVDPLAVIVRTLHGEPVGYIQRPINAEIAALIDSGRVPLARVDRPPEIFSDIGVYRVARALVWIDGSRQKGQESRVRTPRPVSCLPG